MRQTAVAVREGGGLEVLFEHTFLLLGRKNSILLRCGLFVPFIILSSAIIHVVMPTERGR